MSKTNRSTSELLRLVENDTAALRPNSGITEERGFQPASTPEGRTRQSNSNLLGHAHGEAA